MALALFDLDHTLLDGDSDELWGEHLCALGILDATRFRAEKARHLQAYREGRLDVCGFLRSALAPLTQHPPATLAAWRADFVRERVAPCITPAAHALVEGHRARGDTLVIVTATNRFVTEPIAALLGVPHLLATEPEVVDGRYTGAICGEPCFRDGKLRHLESWRRVHGGHLSDATFYSDSHNDLPLLAAVGEPVAVDPDPELARVAAQRGWRTISLRAASLRAAGHG